MKAKRHRKTSLLIALATLIAIGDSARGAPIACAAAADPVEKMICATSALVEADRRIAHGFDRRLAQCTPRRRAALRQTQKFWVRDRNACLSALTDDDGTLRGCIADRMAERLSQLDLIGPACDLNAVADQYRYVDPGYLIANAPRYAGRKVAIFGSLRPSVCDVRSSSRVGSVRSMDGKAEAFPVRFEELGAEQREALCSTQPASHWSGIVRLAGARYYLDLDTPND